MGRDDRFALIWGFWLRRFSAIPPTVTIRVGKPQSDNTQILTNEFAYNSEAAHNIEEIKNLSVTQTQDTIRDAPQTSSSSPPLSPISTRKRAAGNDLATADVSHKLRS